MTTALQVSPAPGDTPPPPDVRVETITPDVARVYLGFNTHNRSLRQRVVSSYAADMRGGDWAWNGESIKFSADDTLLDGQHRLAAVIEADLPVQMLVIRGLPPKVQETMDGGAKRKFADVLQLRGETQYVTLAATVRAVTAWESGLRGSFGSHTNAQMLQTLDTYPWLRDGCVIVGRATHAAGLPASVGGLLWWLTTRIDAEDASHFFERLSSAENHSSGDPIYELRKAVANTTSVRGERSTRYLLAIAIKAWNKYRAGEQIGQLKFRPGGANPERFPEPQ